MGAAAAAVPYIIAALGTAVSVYSENQAASRQDKAAAAGILRQGQLQSQANQKVNQTVQKISQSNPDQFKVQDTKQYLAALQQAQGNAQSGYNNQPANNALAAWAARNQAGQQTYADTTSGLMSGVDAPMQQRQQEGFELGNLGSDLGSIGIDSRNQQYLTNLKVGSIRPNPWLMALGQTAQGAGRGSAMAGG